MPCDLSLSVANLCINSWIKLIPEITYFNLPRIFAENHFSALSSFLPFTDF